MSLKRKKTRTVETNLGELIAALYEETQRVVGEEEANIVVAYILNDFLSERPFTQ